MPEVVQAAVPEDGVRLTFVSTGSVQIRESMKSQPISNRNVLLRRFRSLTDQRWSESLPVGVFIISHPDGPILFDAGESPQCNDPGFMPFWCPTQFFARASIAPDEGVIAQLRKLGIDPQSLQAVVMSHLHSDHAGGLEDLAKEAPHVPIYVNQDHWHAFGNSPLSATIAGCNPQRWPKNFSPRIMEYTDSPVGPWKRSCSITRDGRVLVVDTPGHVPGHISLIVYGVHTDGSPTTWLLPGDATYGLQFLSMEEPDGVNDDPVTAMESLKLMKEFARQTDVVILPSHDPDTPRMLSDRVIYKPEDSSTTDT